MARLMMIVTPRQMKVVFVVDALMLMLMVMLFRVVLVAL